MDSGLAGAAVPINRALQETITPAPRDVFLLRGRVAEPVFDFLVGVHQADQSMNLVRSGFGAPKDPCTITTFVDDLKSDCSATIKGSVFIGDRIAELLTPRRDPLLRNRPVHAGRCSDRRMPADESSPVNGWARPTLSKVGRSMSKGSPKPPHRPPSTVNHFSSMAPTTSGMTLPFRVQYCDKLVERCLLNRTLPHSRGHLGRCRRWPSDQAPPVRALAKAVVPMRNHPLPARTRRRHPEPPLQMPRPGRAPRPCGHCADAPCESPAWTPRSM